MMAMLKLWILFLFFKLIRKARLEKIKVSRMLLLISVKKF